MSNEAQVKKMNDIMEFFRNKVNELDGVKIQEIKDYDKGIEGLPRSNVLKLIFAELLVNHTILIPICL